MVGNELVNHLRAAFRRSGRGRSYVGYIPLVSIFVVAPALATLTSLLGVPFIVGMLLWGTVAYFVSGAILRAFFSNEEDE